ncbi:hypothetical protein [Burkholderia sp. KCJ3K979]|uniref:hypothetical protein n=1 Tax=Burkholderia sp. KCJ3K979 TaxID=2759149 RepID=UPI003FA4D416
MTIGIVAGRGCGCDCARVAPLAIEGEAATADTRRRVRPRRNRHAPGSAFADHPDRFAGPRVPRGVEMLQPQRDRVAPQRAREFVDEGFAGKDVRVTGNRAIGIDQLDRRLRVPVDERRCGAGIGACRGSASIVRGWADCLRTVAPRGHPAVGRGPRFDIERGRRARIADRPGVACAVRRRGGGGRVIVRCGFRHTRRRHRRTCVRLHRRLADSVRRDAPRG